MQSKQDCVCVCIINMTCSETAALTSKKTNMVHKLSNTDYEARQNFLQPHSATANSISECIHWSQHAEFLT
jgi:hypothetical protein